jgi:hypothetical protein
LLHPGGSAHPQRNLQGTYKFLSLATGKKVKRRAFMPYPILDLVIKKVNAYGKLTALTGIFDFASTNGILFEWNKEELSAETRSPTTFGYSCATTAKCITVLL